MSFEGLLSPFLSLFSFLLFFCFLSQLCLKKTLPFHLCFSMSFCLSHLFIAFVFLWELFFSFGNWNIDLVRIYNLFLHHNIEVKFSWLFSKKTKSVTRRIILISVNLHPYDSAFYYLVEKNCAVITWALIAIQKKFILFEQLISFNGISWQKNLASRRKNKFRAAVGSMLIKELNFKVNILVRASIMSYLFDFR